MSHLIKFLPICPKKCQFLFRKKNTTTTTITLILVEILENDIRALDKDSSALLKNFLQIKASSDESSR